MINSYDECVKYIDGLHKSKYPFEAKDRNNWLKLISIPDKTRIIHIAGTNGKGSTAAFMNSILRAASYNVGLFTSPHLVSINERIVFNDRNISDADFLEAFDFIMDNVKGRNLRIPPFFDFIFIMAMHYYEKHPVDFLILETGLGGRLDATNFLPRKDISIITGIGMDHMDYLGDTIAKIAGEKAGIIKENVPVVFYNQRDDSEGVIVDRAKEENCDFFFVEDKDIFVNNVAYDGIDFSVASSYYRYDSLKIGMNALYQTRNAALSILGIKVLLGEEISDKDIYEGVLKAKWPGRMERLLKGVYLDGAHNPHGIKAFIESVSELKTVGRRFLVFGVLEDKKYDTMIEQIYLSGLFNRIYVAHVESYRAVSIDELKPVFAKYDDIDVSFFDDPLLALRSALREKEADDEIFVTGSLYMIGQIKSEFLE